MRAAIVLCLVSSCSFSLTGSPVVGDDSAPGDGPFDVAEIDALDGSPNFDTDNDGLNDAVDNCPNLPNVDQRNWDADPRGDACDPCPHLMNADTDGDSDGVGDACDPRPSIAGDSRALWLGFYSATDVTGWVEPSTGGDGTWTVTGGALVQSIPDANPFASFVAPILYQRTYVATSIEIISMEPDATIGMCSGWDGASFDCCNINTTNPAPVIEAQTGTAVKQNLPFAGSLAAGSRVDIVQNMLTANTCRFAGTLSVQTTPTAISGKVLFFVGRAAARFRYLFVAQIGP